MFNLDFGLSAIRLIGCAALLSGCGVEEPPPTGPVGDCTKASVLETTPRTARRARSAGFSGTDEAYTALYAVSCASVSDCSKACTQSGGTQEMCAASECLTNGVAGMDCLPPPVWSNLQGIQLQSEVPEDAAQIVAVDSMYRDHLLTDQFALEVPAQAVIRGIQVGVRRAGFDGSIGDDSVRLLKAGQPAGAERAAAEPWASPKLEWAEYGGSDDLWGVSWTPAEVNAAGFGVAQSVLYGKTVGNSRAYVSQVRVTVYYSNGSECL